MPSPLPYLSDAQWSEIPARERALLLAAQEADRYRVRETGRNDGPRVREYLRAAGVTIPANWCASFVTWCCLQAGYTRSDLVAAGASVCNWHQWAKRLSRTLPVTLVKRGDLFLWCDEKRWRGHIGFVVQAYRVGPLWWIRTIEGNASPQHGGRDGDGVYRKLRLVRSNFRFVRLP